jgi:flagellar biosynthesis chaperone FliJ
MQGRGELVDALNDKTLKPEEIDQKQLPADLQKLDREELRKRITKARDERADLQKQIAELSKKREAYIQSENKRLAAEGKGDAFDQKVTEALHAQAAKKGITY